MPKLIGLKKEADKWMSKNTGIARTFGETIRKVYPSFQTATFADVPLDRA